MSTPGIFTPREQEIASLLVAGVPVKRVAQLLQPPISRRTVEVHVAHMGAKVPGEGRPLYRIISHVLREGVPRSAA